MADRYDEMYQSCAVIDPRQLDYPPVYTCRYNGLLSAHRLMCGDFVHRCKTCGAELEQKAEEYLMLMRRAQAMRYDDAGDVFLEVDCRGLVTSRQRKSHGKKG
jgi:hypothetical protein